MWDCLCLRQRFDVDEVLSPFYPSGGLVVWVEQDEALHQLGSPLSESDQDVGTKAGAQANKGENPEMVADVLHTLGELLHVGEGVIFWHGRGARLLARGVDVDHGEVSEDEAHAGAVKQLLVVGDVIETEVVDCDKDGRGAEAETLSGDLHRTVRGVHTHPLVIAITWSIISPLFPYYLIYFPFFNFPRFN